MTPFAALLVIMSLISFGLGWSTRGRIYDKRAALKKKAQQEYQENILRYSRRR